MCHRYIVRQLVINNSLALTVGNVSHTAVIEIAKNALKQYS